MKSLLEYLDGLPAQTKLLGCLLLSLLLGVVDYITQDYSLSLFYLIPISFASWFIGKRTARYIALFCGMELYIVDLLVAPGKISIVSLRSWNALMEVGYLLLTAYLISVVRTEMEKTRQRSIELESLNLELSAFNYTVAHDLRSPLVWIGGYCRSILKHHCDRLDEVPREQLREVCEGTLRMEQLITSLLDFSQMAHGELNYEFVDLSEMTKSIVEKLVKTEPERQATFKIAEGIACIGDKRLLGVVVENLLSNAWKYTSEQKETVIEFGVSKFKGSRAYFVRDNGAGFDMESTGKLFVPFQRLHDSDRFKGHGIGLATVKRIVIRHKGEIWAQSRSGKGATFYFTVSGDRISQSHL
jgi:light-regulated signal transduction histidine kinase (bacteriophytochrome)